MGFARGEIWSSGREELLLQQQTEESCNTRIIHLKIIKIMNSVFEIFIEGGWPFMFFITLALVGILFSAWKAPRWVKYFARVALIGGATGLFLGIMQICDIMQEVEVATPVLAGGIKVVTIAPIYSLIVYFLSIIIRIVQTPRI